jgi:oligosaccharide reducing-end xylanase
MKIIFKSIIVFVLLLVTQTGFSQVTSPYQVGTWLGFRTCAISYTFDDGCANQFTKAIPMFDEVGYKLTLFTVTGWGPNWTNLQNAAKKGHEVANHTANHTNLGSATLETQKTEIETANELINSKITSQKCVTMATPYCAKGNDDLASKYFIAVRGCQGFIEPKTPGSFMNVSSVICGSLGAVMKVKDFKTKADQAATSKGWLVYLIHGIDADGGYSPLGSDTLKASIQYLKENDRKFWVNTFGNVARYCKERNCVSVTETLATETSITVNITDTLSNNEWYNYPLTLRRTMPEGWSSAAVTQNGTDVDDTIIEENSVKYIQFEAIPDGGSISISKVSSTGKNDIRGSMNNDFNLWINHNELRFSIPEICEPNPTVSFFDLKGSKIISFINFTTTGRIGMIDLNNSIPKPAVYLVQLSDSKTSWLKKIRLM